MLFPILCCVIQGVQFENYQKSMAVALQKCYIFEFDPMLVYTIQSVPDQSFQFEMVTAYKLSLSDP